MTAGLPRLTLVLGGARSGKSRYGEQLVENCPPPWRYIATANAYDDEMKLRIAKHQDRRSSDWISTDAPLDLADALVRPGPDGSSTQPLCAPMLVDCLTLWLTNVMLAEKDVDHEIGLLCHVLEDLPGPVVVISNEVGLSIVPDNELARRFRDLQGALNQRVAEIADQVVFVAAGLPLHLKPKST